ncbi:MAG: hypothetical protein GF309_13335 [Candidatus Lokiarchaeota archaeon]|nr:hypothetical protein [Candidatus Lokiarchaeota archaeon]
MSSLLNEMNRRDVSLNRRQQVSSDIDELVSDGLGETKIAKAADMPSVSDVLASAEDYAQGRTKSTSTIDSRLEELEESIAMGPEDESNLHDDVLKALKTSVDKGMTLLRKASRSKSKKTGDISVEDVKSIGTETKFWQVDLEVEGELVPSIVRLNRTGNIHIMQPEDNPFSKCEKASAFIMSVIEDYWKKEAKRLKTKRRSSREERESEDESLSMRTQPAG